MSGYYEVMQLQEIIKQLEKSIDISSCKAIAIHEWLCENQPDVYDRGLRKASVNAERKYQR